MSGDQTVGLREASEILGVHYMTVYRHVRTGRLAATWDGAEWRVRRTDLTATKRRPRKVPAGPRGQRPPHQVGELVSRLTAADEAGAWWIVESALAAGASAAVIHVDLIAAAMRRIGDLWATGDLTFADEHRASAVAHRLIGRLGPHFQPRGRRRGGVVVGAIEGDLHGLPAAIVANLLRAEGFDVQDLGANVPHRSFVESALGVARLRGISIAVTTPQCARAVPQLVTALRRGGVTAPILVGGSGVTEAATMASGATAYTATAADVVDRILAGARGRET